MGGQALELVEEGAQTVPALGHGGGHEGAVFGLLAALAQALGDAAEDGLQGDIAEARLVFRHAGAEVVGGDAHGWRAQALRRDLGDVLGTGNLDHLSFLLTGGLLKEKRIYER